MGEEVRLIAPLYERPITWQTTFELADGAQVVVGRFSPGCVSLSAPPSGWQGKLDFELGPLVELRLSGGTRFFAGFERSAWASFEEVEVSGLWTDSPSVQYHGTQLSILEKLGQSVLALADLKEPDLRNLWDLLWDGLYFDLCEQDFHEATAFESYLQDTELELEDYAERLLAARQVVRLTPGSALREHCEKRLPDWTGTASSLLKVAAVASGCESHPDMALMVAALEAGTVAED